MNNPLVLLSKRCLKTKQGNLFSMRVLRLEWTNTENANSLWKFIIIFGKIAVRLFEAVRRLNLTKAFIINSYTRQHEVN